MNFTLLQLHWDNIAYFQHSRAINEEYCLQHGYTYVAREPEDVDNPFRRLYHRGPVALSLLPQNEFDEEGQLIASWAVLYLDADAYIVDLDRTLESIMDSYFQDENTAILMPEDGFDSKRRFPGGGVNTGVFLIRDHAQLEPMFQAWWDAYTPALAALSPTATDHQRFLAINDQEVFNKKVLPSYRSNINIARNPEFGGVDGNFVRHQLLIPNIEREKRIERDRLALLGS